MTTSARALESPATFAAVFRAQADAHLDDAGVDVGDRVVAEDDLAADDQVLADDLAGQVGAQRGNADLGLLADCDLADVLLVHLGDGVHDVGVADFEDALVAHALARPDVDAQDLPFDRRAHLGRLEVGTGHLQAGLGLDQLGLGDLDVGRTDRLERGEFGLGLIERVAGLAHT